MSCTSVHRYMAVVAVCGLVLASCAGQDAGERATSSTAERSTAGTLTPRGTPLSPPVRTEAGCSCIVDLRQGYQLSGALSGHAEIDYRIRVAGPCGSPQGTFDEEWIAHGRFTGHLRGASATGDSSYVARVLADGTVEGQMAFGRGLRGELRVYGDFADGSLSYEGHVEQVSHR
jgi:hypothetical protein